jgi:hypothetical protein
MTESEKQSQLPAFGRKLKAQSPKFETNSNVQKTELPKQSQFA